MAANGQTTVYADDNGALYAVPTAGGASKPLAGTQCRRCTGQISPDSAQFLAFDAENNVLRVPLDGTASTVLTQDASTAVFSADSQQVAYAETDVDQSPVFTLPVTGGLPTQLHGNFATDLLWTPAGLLELKRIWVKKWAQFRLVLTDPSGATKRIYSRHAIKTEAQYDTHRFVQVPFSSAGTKNFVSLEGRRKHTAVLRLIALSSGKSSHGERSAISGSRRDQCE